MEYFLGIDGGGTRSSLILIDSKGNKVLEKKGKSLNYRAVGEEKFIKNLDNLISNIKKDVKYSCLALAGVDNKKERENILKLIKKSSFRKYFKSYYFLVNDVEAILPTIDSRKGIAIIAGTGSNFYAKNGKKSYKAGGLGYILSDEGSAFDIGQKVLRAAIKSNDGRGEKTILEKMVLRQAKTKNARDLKTLIHKGILKQNVAAFAHLTEKAIEKKDKVIKEILLSAADDLEKGAVTVAKKVELSGEFKICLIGSALKNKFLLKELSNRLRKRFKKAEILKVENPALGAAKLALNEKKNNYVAA